MNKNKKSRHIPLAYIAEEAFKKAVAEALAEHRLHGIPVAIWQNGKVIHIPPEEIMVRDSKVEYRTIHKMKKN